jgi:hypothetical protein
MQVCRPRTYHMQRDMDLIRDLLLGIEQDQRLDGTCYIVPDQQDNFGIIGIKNNSLQEVAYHLAMLIEAGFVEGDKGTLDRAMPGITKLTWQGHEFLDAIRDPGIWGKTKERLKGLPSAGIAIIGEIAKAEIKKHLGLP